MMKVNADLYALALIELFSNLTCIVSQHIEFDSKIRIDVDVEITIVLWLGLER